ncbi:putative major facilitator superfamily transporter [Lophium mytilinum]|uniref:Putative major facilitator superfamily transporter n=1 Tax=Lophium mytilinum TaxID=390894 RepID=A0A6A6R0N9_9PEZI|nr:putative major facilitator superfamily transporter [Lophium mytilinum]
MADLHDKEMGVHEKDTTHHIENFETAEEQNAYAVKGDDSDGHIPMTPRRFIAMVSLLMSYVGANLPLFFISGSLTFLQASIKNPQTQGWSTTSYGVALAAVTPFSGYLQDLIGRRYVVLLGSLLICIGLAVIGSSHRFLQLIFGCVITGIGAGITEITSTAGLAEVVSVKHRGYTLALLYAFILPFAPYVLYAQLLGEHATWRWSIWLALIYNAVALAGLAFSYFPRSHLRAEGVRRRDLAREVDFFGGFLSTAGIVLFLVGLQSGGTIWPWKNGKVIAPMVVGLVLIFAFIIWEWKGAKYPMVPPAIFKGQRIVGACMVTAFVVGMNLYAVLNFMPLMFATVYDPDPMHVGLKALAFGFGQTVGATVMNVLMSVFKNHQRENLLSSCFIMTVFIAALAAVTPDNAKTVIALTALAGWGVGGIIAPIATVALSATPDSFLATVISLINALKFLGGSIGYSIYYAIFSGKLKVKLPATVAAYAIQAGLPLTSVEGFVGIFLTDPTKLATTPIPGLTPAVIAAASSGLRWAYADSVKFVWYTTIPFGVICIGAVLVMGNTRKYQTNRVAAALE